MKVFENHPLTSYNTFGLPARAAFFADVSSEDELRQVFAQSVQPLMLLGGGSNILLTRDWPGTVVRLAIKGLEIVEETPDTTTIAAGAGEIWHDLVAWTLSQNLGGLENLSLIPGSVGAAPIQNIGAYGVELTDMFDRLEALEIASGAILTFDRAACRFGYRDSFFKQEGKGKYAITRVFLRLQKTPKINTGYGAIRDTLAEWGIAEPTIHDVSKAVIHIRRSKLPDPALLGNAGSFFKNPEVEAEQLQTLLQSFPNLVNYPLPGGRAKLAAGWLIEQCGWKGKRVGNTGCHAQQSLVIVNYGGATGEEIWEHAQRVAASVKQRFGVELGAEVNVY